MVDPIPPHDDEQERHALYAMLSDPDACATAVEMLGPQHFYMEDHGRVFKAVKALYVQRGTVELTLLKTGIGERTRDAVLDVIQNGVSSPAYIGDYCKGVLALYEKHNIDDLIITDDEGRVAGIIDIQDLPKLKIL